MIVLHKCLDREYESWIVSTVHTLKTYFRVWCRVKRIAICSCGRTFTPLILIYTISLRVFEECTYTIKNQGDGQQFKVFANRKIIESLIIIKVLKKICSSLFNYTLEPSYYLFHYLIFIFYDYCINNWNQLTNINTQLYYEVYYFTYSARNQYIIKEVLLNFKIKYCKIHFLCCIH